MGNLHGDEQRHSVTLQLVTRLSGPGVVFGGHKDRAALSVGEQVVVRLLVQVEAILDRPIHDLLSASLNHRHIERLDLHLLDHLRRTRGGVGLGSKEKAARLRVALNVEPLQCPGPAILNALRDRRQGNDPAYSRG